MDKDTSFKYKCRKLLLQKIEANELDLNPEYVVNDPISIAPVGGFWAYSLSKRIQEKLTEEIEEELRKLFRDR